MSEFQNKQQEYTQLLDDCRSGSNTFKIYLEETFDFKLREILLGALTTFKDQEILLTKNICELGYNIEDNINPINKMSEMIEKFKAKLFDNDKIADYALKNIESYLKTVTHLGETTSALSKDLSSSLNILADDYRKIYQELTNFKLNKLI